MSLRACGLVEGGEAGLELLTEAVRALERSQVPIELARALADQTMGPHCGAPAAAYRRAPGSSAHWISPTNCGAQRIGGAQRIANQARTELIAAGAKPRRDAITGR